MSAQKKKIRTIPLTQYYKELKISEAKNDVNDVTLAEFSFVCAKYYLIVHNLRMYYSTEIKKVIARNYLGCKKGKITKFLKKFSEDNDISIDKIAESISQSRLLSSGGSIYVKSILDAGLSLVNKRIDNKFYYVTRILNLLLYAIGGGKDEVYDISRVLTRASINLKKIILRKNDPYFPGNSKVLDRKIVKDVNQKLILQLFFNIIYGYIKASNFENELNTTKIRTLLEPYFNSEEFNIKGITAKLKSLIDPLLPTDDYREYYRGDHSSNLSDDSVIESHKENEKAIHSSIFSIKNMFGYSNKFNRFYQTPEGQFTTQQYNSNRSVYEDMLVNVLITDNSAKDKYTIPSENDTLSYEPSNSSSKKKKRSYMNYDINSLLTTDDTIKSSTTEQKDNQLEEKPFIIDDMPISDKTMIAKRSMYYGIGGYVNSFLTSPDQEYKVRVTSDDIKQSNTFSSIRILITNDDKVNIFTYGIALSEELIHDLFDHFYNNPDISFDKVEEITFDKVPHKYVIN